MYIEYYVRKEFENITFFFVGTVLDPFQKHK